MGLALFSMGINAQIYELRTYTTNDGKLENLHARFRDHTQAIFDKHGMKSLGYWVPKDEHKSKNTLIYILEHENRESAKVSWKNFIADPNWLKVAKESQINGRILAKAPESIFMTSTDYSPLLNKRSHDSNELNSNSVFELRIYKTNKDKLENLDARFRDNTIGIFDRFNMESIGYWHSADTPDSSDTLIYILRHDSMEAAKSAWRSFGGDKEWQRVAVESQLDGQILRERPESVFMRATDYSLLR